MEKKNEIFGVFMIFQESRYRFSFALSLSLICHLLCRSAIQFAPTVTREIDDRYERREKKKKIGKRREEEEKKVSDCADLTTDARESDSVLERKPLALLFH